MPDDETIGDLLSRIRELAGEALKNDGVPAPVQKALAEIYQLADLDRDLPGEASDPLSTENQSL